MGFVHFTFYWLLTTIQYVTTWAIFCTFVINGRPSQTNRIDRKTREGTESHVPDRSKSDGKATKGRSFLRRSEGQSFWVGLNHDVNKDMKEQSNLQKKPKPYKPLGKGYSLLIPDSVSYGGKKNTYRISIANTSNGSPQKNIIRRKGWLGVSTTATRYSFMLFYVEAPYLLKQHW